MSHMVDDKIKESLMEGTKEAVELKDSLWDNIEKELDLKFKPKKNKSKALIKCANIAAVLVIVLIFNTQYGQAAVAEIKKIFQPNKNITQQVEGVDKEINTDLNEDASGYIIYVDPENYLVENKEGKKKIIAKTKANNAPEVFMEISEIKDKNTDIVSKELTKELKLACENIESPVKGKYIYVAYGTKWNSKVEKYYFLDNNKGGTIIIKQQLFVEAEEGHGTRMDNMIKEFQLTNK